MTVLEILQEDYARFPKDQTYSIYADDVFFKDPVTQFRGIDRYRRNIQFIDKWFLDLKFDLHEMEQTGDRIETRWTLSWTAPLPWKPRLAITGRSELEINAEGLIDSHIDYWNEPPLSVVRQLFDRRDRD